MRTLSNLILVFLFISIPVSLHSQNYIAVQHGSILTQYTTLDAAITGAEAGDFIFIPGGNYTLSTNINKKLFIYGAGHYPDSTSVTNETKVESSATMVSGANEGLISGVHITGTVKFGTSSSNQIVNNYTIQRCKIDGDLKLSFDGTTTTLSNNFYISENIILGILYGGNSQTVIVEKNIFENYIINFQSGGTFRNNIFFYYHWYYGFSDFSVFGYDAASSIKNCLFENNIILDHAPLYCTPPTTYLQNCIFNNNLFIYSQAFPYQTNIGSNNIVNQTQSSIFVNQSGNIFSYSHDYHLKSTCLGKNAGTDGTDIGIYGTGQPYKAGAVPANPHIRQKIITTQNNQINVNIKVAAQDR
jgi:hypothetical protein